MTTTFNEYEAFYQRLYDVVTLCILNRLKNFELLHTQPDIVRRRETLMDIITLFSQGDSIMVAIDDKPGHTLTNNIEEMIKSYYGNRTATTEIIGTTPLDSVIEELGDMAYSIQPMIYLPQAQEYIRRQGLTEYDRNMIEADADNDLTTLIACILCVIKAANMTMVLKSIDDASKGKGRRVKED